MSRKIPIALLIACMASPAIAAEQFDLICTSKSEREHYRVDLDRSEWCAGDCSQVMKFQSVTSGMLTMHDHIPTFPRDSRYSLTVNRVTGEWLWYNFNPVYRSTQDIKGTCTAAPFSGINAGATRF